MAQVLRCCPLQSSNQPYIGVDQKCTQLAIFCIQHSPHKNTQGLMHQMLPLKHFKKTLQQKKFLMNEKIGILIDQYNNLMDSLIEQIRQLKLRKNIEFSMLWLRQLAKDQEEYELMRQIYRMDFKDLTCALVHSIYFKIVHNQVLEKKTVKEIDCYKGIAQILQHLSQERQTRSFLSKKIAQIEGILENGEILKRALPDKLVLKENIKQVLLESPQVEFVDIKYNKCRLTRNSRQYISVFSKYPIVQNVLYHINFTTKYTNVMLGICTQTLVNASNSQMNNIENSEYDQSRFSNESSAITELDKHYSKESLVFNCTNGCVYKDGMFESGSNALTKGQKELVLKMRITSTNQLIILLGKNVLCRQKLDNLISKRKQKDESTKLYLHVLMRTEGDCFDVDRDKDVSSDQLPQRMDFTNNQNLANNIAVNPRENINFDQIKKRNEQEVMNVNNLKEEILAGKDKVRESNDKKNNSDSQFSCDFKHLNSSKLLGQLNAQSSQTINKQKHQQKQRRQTVKKQLTKLQEKRKKIEDKPASNYKKFSDIEKQQKINQIIKKERIDKILNDLKSKPANLSGLDTKRQADVSNTIVARKLKEIQQRKAATRTLGIGNQPNVESSKYKRPQFNQEDSQTPQKNLQILKLMAAQNSYHQEPSYHASIQQNGSPLFNSNEINPLMMLQKPPKFSGQSPYSKTHSQQSHGEYVNSNHKDMQEFDEQVIEKTMNKLRPQQKVFKLDQDDSYHFNSSKDDSVDLNSGADTPIDKIQNFQFSKKSIKQLSGLQNKQTLAIKKGPSTLLLPTLHEDEQSHVMENYDMSLFDRKGSPKISINQGLRIPGQLVMPQLKQSHFSKMTSQSNLNTSNLEESFGVQNERRKRLNTEIKDMKDGMLRVSNPRDKNTEVESAIQIDIKSQYKSGYSMSDKNSFHIGNVMGPKQKLVTKDQNNQSFNNHSFENVSQKAESRDQSVINIRGLQYD